MKKNLSPSSHYQGQQYLGKFLLSSLLLALAPHAAASADLKVGDTICTVGYVMDYFCIQRGTLFDNRSVETLSAEGPKVHTVHCLIDVPSCVSSPFEILLEDGEDGAHGRAFRVEDNELLIEYAKMVGDCTEGCIGTQKSGLKAAIVGEVLNFGNVMTPPTIRVTSVSDADLGCTMENVKVIDESNVPNMVMNNGGSLNRIFIIHGVLMLIGWGLLLPSGAIVAKFLKHRPDSLWFKIHRVCQMLGLIVAIIGFAIILVNSNALMDKGSASLNHPHAVMGIVTMSIGLFQPFNALLRPHAPEEGSDQKKTTLRLVWEVVHKGLGWGVLVLAAVTIGIGTTLLSTPEMQRNFQISYGAVVGSLLLALLAFALTDKKKFAS